MWKGYKVIDADAHAFEPDDLYDRYTEPDYRDRAVKEGFRDGRGGQRVAPGRHESQIAKFGDAYLTGFSPETRLKDMDRFGWDVQVILSSPTGNDSIYVAARDPGLGGAMCRAYNNWSYEYCSLDPKRLKFVALLPGSSVEDLITETKRSIDTLGAVSTRSPFLPEGKWLHHREYDPFWQLVTEMDFGLSVHGEYRHKRFQPFKVTDEYRGEFSALNHVLGFPMDNMATLGHYVFGHIFDRFPKLRIGLLESNAGWLPFFLGRMDDHSHGRNRVTWFDDPPLKMTPSDYFKRNCVIACDGDEVALKYVVDFLGDDHIVWNTDYPHPDAPDPVKALPDLEAQLISKQAKKKILWDNSIKLYGDRILSK